MRWEESYEILQVLKDKDGTKVCIVRHKELHVDRVMKSVQVQASFGIRNAEKDLSGEAMLLAHLRHPGIPVLYDSYYEEGVLYWIEEFIRGEPLSHYLMRHSVTERQIAHVMCSLMDILLYLHSRRPAIIYQDLKPEHIYLRGDGIVLIDYGLSGTVRERNPLGGSPSFAAPEQMRGESADERSDLYSLGKVAELMGTHVDGTLSMFTKALIRSALAKDRNHRPESISVYRDSWEKRYRSLEEKQRGKSAGCHLPQSIALIGAEEGVGCTHLAVSLTVLMNRAGDKAWYENPREPMAQKICAAEDCFEEKKGIIYHGCFVARPWRGEGLAEYEPPEGIRIIDCGTEFFDAEVKIGVVGSNAWKCSGIRGNYEDFDLVIVNPGNRQVGQELRKLTDVPVLGFPADRDALSVTREKRKFYKVIREVMGD